jgi:hypothetical protein
MARATEGLVDIEPAAGRLINVELLLGHPRIIGDRVAGTVGGIGQVPWWL